jgi:hypothetical protein
MEIVRKSFAWAAVATLFVLLLPIGNATSAQTKGKLVSGNLYRVHGAFLELKNGEKDIVLVPVDAATIYWDGKGDKAATKKDLTVGDEIVAELLEKDGAMVAKRVRFLHRVL